MRSPILIILGLLCALPAAAEEPFLDIDVPAALARADRTLVGVGQIRYQILGRADRSASCQLDVDFQLARDAHREGGFAQTGWTVE